MIKLSYTLGNILPYERYIELKNDLEYYKEKYKKLKYTHNPYISIKEYKKKLNDIKDIIEAIKYYMKSIYKENIKEFK